jgi:transposase
MQLGALDLPKSLWPMLAAELERQLAGLGGAQQLALLEADGTVRKAADRAMARYLFEKNRTVGQEPKRGDKRLLATVDIDSATTAWSRSLGPELVGHHVWNELKMPAVLEECGLSERERSLAEAVVLGRLIAPGSDLATWRWLRDLSAVGELTEAPVAQVKKDAVYEIADLLLRHKRALEEHLLDREKQLFPGRESLYLFDLTNFYFEGQAKGNALAARGKSKQKRNDCPLVSLALVVDAAGFPVTSRVYEGNVGEPTTLREILEDMGWLETEEGQLRIPETRPTLVMDRGLATGNNLKMLREEGLPYIVIERCGRQSEYTDQFASWPEGFDRVTKPGREDVWAQKVEGSDEKTVRVLCKSEARREKEKAMAERWTGRAQDDLQRLAKSVAKGYVRALDKVHQRIGRLKERYAGFDKRFAVEVAPDPLEEKKAAAIHWQRLAAREQQSETLAGCYVIETTHTHRCALDIWSLYMTLTRVESAFRGLKSDLGTRPIFHQLAERTEGHLFTSVLAYHLLNSIEHRLGHSGDHRRWFKVRDVLSTHRRSTIIFTDDQGVVHHIRNSGEAEPAHAEIYDNLGVKDPTLRNHYEVGRV